MTQIDEAKRMARLLRFTPSLDKKQIGQLMAQESKLNFRVLQE